MASVGIIENPHCLDFEASPIFSVQIDNQVAVPAHRHTYYEISIVIKGTGRHQTNEIVIDVAPLDVFIVPVGAIHHWSFTHNLSVLNIYYSPGHFAFPVDSVGSTSLYAFLFFASEFFEKECMRSIVHFQICKKTLLRILKELSGAAIFKKFDDLSLDSPVKNRLLSNVYFKDAQRLFSEGSFLKVIASLTVDYLINRSLATSGKPLHPVIYRLAETLDQAASIGNAPDLADQAMILGISPEYMTRLFTEGIGVSPLKFFNKRRLAYAKRLLLSSALNMTQIAQKFGFSDSAHFSNSFKEHFNLTPSEFRQKASRSTMFNRN
jgi:AraC family transcriptional regulator, transcriptional activator of pobA